MSGDTQVFTFKAYPHSFGSNAAGEIKLSLMLEQDQLDKVTDVMHHRDEVLTFVVKRTPPVLDGDVVENLREVVTGAGIVKETGELDWDE